MILCAQDINKFFYTQNGKQIEALKDVSLSVRKHEFVAIVGPSGCGKSTLLNVLAGLYEPDTGQVLINGSPSRSSSVKRGHISQADTLLPWRTIMENVELGLEIRGMAKKKEEKLPPC